MNSRSVSDSAVHLVGSVNLSGAEEVFREGAEHVGDLVVALPDGETDHRRAWIQHLAYKVFYPNTDLIVRQRPTPPGWYAATFEDQWSFEVEPHLNRVTLGELGYAAAAGDAYRLLRRLRDEGAAADDIRLQVALPFVPSGIGFVAQDVRTYRILADAYRESLRAEIDRLLDVVPAEDLSIQWDLAFEVIAQTGVIPWASPEEAWEDTLRYAEPLSETIPNETLLGYHLCYGSWENRHAVEPTDLGISVRLANALIDGAARPVDFVHMTVPISRTDDAYFAPLDDLRHDEIGRVYLGLVHLGDGVDGARQRIAAARPHLTDFGISTECGMGRFARAEIIELLTLHRTIATEALATT